MLNNIHLDYILTLNNSHWWIATMCRDRMHIRKYLLTSMHGCNNTVQLTMQYCLLKFHWIWSVKACIKQAGASEGLHDRSGQTQLWTLFNQMRGQPIILLLCNNIPFVSVVVWAYKPISSNNHTSTLWLFAQCNTL